MLSLFVSCWSSAGQVRLVMRHETDGPWQVTRMSYLISDIALQRPDGSWLAVPDVIAWFNLERTDVHLKSVPEGDYRALRFQVGLNAKEDRADPASWGPGHVLNPAVNGLHWSWQGGYIFMALEGSWQRKDGSKSGFAFHMGNEFMRTVITLPAQISVAQATAVEVAVNVSAILKDIDFIEDGASTHSADDDPLAYDLRDNLKSAFRVLKSEPTEVESSQPAGPLVTLKLGSLPQPKLPADNPLTPARVALGRALFHDPALSRTNAISCASCHLSGHALSDPRQFSIGVDGRLGDRNAMPLFNLAWKDSFFWDGRVKTLREQVLVPIEDHREMDETLENVQKKLAVRSAEFHDAFGSEEVTIERMALALEAFLLTLTSHNSKFDRAQRGEVKLTAEEQRGFELFMSEREPRLGAMGADCFHCHGGALFSDHLFRNNGLEIDPKDTGRHRVTNISLDKGAFVTPSLRNIALTAPYMHDGRFKTLEEVLDHYSHGIHRTDTLDPNLAKHPDGGLALTEEEKRSVIAFLKTLTDE
jgi:cytochrome c peroxidase